MFFVLCSQLGWENEEAKEKAKKKYGLDSFANIGKDQISELIDKMSEKANASTKKALIAILDMYDFGEFMEGNNQPIPTTAIVDQILKYFYVREK